MNFNYDLMTWIDYFIGAFACCFGMVMAEKILFQAHIKEIKWYYYMFIIVFSIGILFNSLIFDNIVKVFGSFLILFLIAKIMFKKDFSEGFLYCIITYIIFLIAEVSMSIILVIFEHVFHINILSVIESPRTIFINVTISILACLYCKLTKYKIKRIVEKINKHKVFSLLVIGIITIFVLLSTMYTLYLNGWKIDYKLILNIVVFVGGIVLFFGLLKQHLTNKEISDKYELLNDYLKNSADIIEKYSSTIHKYKNNLIAIKGYIKNNDKEAERYIDNLLGEFNYKKYNWFNKINYINIDSMRYLIYYKLSKAETENLKITVDVSKDIKKYTNDFITTKESNTLLEIIGEYFDNAIYASNESNEKELNLILYDDNERLVFTIANTYKGEVNLNAITKNGYTTKGKGHGLGLYDIDKTIRKNEWLSVSYELLENYFVAKLIINKK